MFKKLFLTAAIITLAACSSSNSTKIVQNSDQPDAEALDTLIVNLRTNRPHQYSAVMDKRLSQVYREWAGTRYRLGGTGRGGIDCSAFMQTTFIKAFGIALPRSTSEQRYVGKSIAKHQLQVGDLVFFRNNHHVGVYIGNNQFMHASTSRGVIIESLDQDYWARTYTQSRRVL